MEDAVRPDSQTALLGTVQLFYTRRAILALIKEVGPQQHVVRQEERPLVGDVILGIFRVLGLCAEGADGAPGTMMTSTQGALFAVDWSTSVLDPEDMVLDLEGNRTILALLPHLLVAAWVCHMACFTAPARRKPRWVQGGHH